MSRLIWNITNCVTAGKYANADFSEYPINTTISVYAFPKSGFFAKEVGNVVVNGVTIPMGRNSSGTGWHNLQITRISETQVRFGTSSANIFDIDGLEATITCTCVRDVSQIGITPTINISGGKLAPFSQVDAYENGVMFVVNNSGYSFEEKPTAVRNGNINIVSSRFQQPSFDEEVYRINVGSPLASFEINGNAVKVAVDEIAIDNNLQNAEADKYTLKLAEVNSFEINAVVGYEFQTPPFLRLNYETGLQDLPFELVNNSYSLTVSGTSLNGVVSASFNGSAVKIVRKIPITLDSEYMKFTDKSATEINETDTSYYVEVEALGGYMFTKPPAISAYYDGVGGVQKTSRAMSPITGKLNTYYYEMNISLYGDNDPQHFFDANDGKGTPNITSEIVVETSLLSDFGAIRAYKTSKVLNRDLFNKRFYNVAENSYEDLGNYIISFVRYPFDVPTLGEASVMFGWFDSKIVAPLVEDGVYTFSLGKKVISGLYGDSSDIAQVDITLVLPYVGTIGLDKRYINTEIEVIYRVDILSNSCVVEVYSNSHFVESVECQIGYTIPYILKTDELTPNVKLTSTLLQSYNPKAIIRQKKRIDGLPMKTAVMHTLSEVSGYVKCGIVRLKTSEQMTMPEQEKIISLLQNGVVF